MLSAGDTAEFLRDPIGRYVAGPSHLIWCHSPSLCGAAHWGAPSQKDIRDFIEQLDFVRHPSMAPRFDVLMDNRAVERVDPDVLFVLGDFVRTRLLEWGARIRLQVVILPEGVAGLLVAGLLPSLGPSHPYRFVTTPEQAFAELQRPDAAVAFARALALAESGGRSRLTAALQAFLTRSPNATVSAAAEAIGVSVRSLQRHLGEESSSFTVELRRARVRVATELLRHTDHKLEAVAASAGFGSTARMNAVFRRELGRSPAELRTESKQQ
jgi:AraC-like DNA-binding protein